MQIDHEIRAKIRGDKLVINNVKIGKEEYSLHVENQVSIISLKFMKCDLEVYEIIIRPDGIQHERLLLRPGHDHNDSETLTKSLDWKRNEVVENTLRIPFGMRVSKESHM